LKTLKTLTNNRCTFLGLLIAGVFALTAAPAQADVMGTIWQNAGDSGNAGDFAGNTLGPHANFTSSGINYCTGPIAGCGAYTASAFLNFPTFTGATAGFDPTLDFNNSFIQLTGTIFLNAGGNPFNIGHDDGLTLTLDGGIGLVVNSPGPTSPTITPFTINAPSTGIYNFTLDYAECCGAPAELKWTYPSGAPVGAPEPGYLELLGASLPALVFFARRLRAMGN
jgi:hypothetical protein